MSVDLPAFNAPGCGSAPNHGIYIAFVDSSTFKTSDLNFFIQVKVVNQKLVAEDITRFNPIKNAKAADFNTLYGDSFISGFIEGGEFNALISVKLQDQDKDLNIKGALTASANFGVAQGDIHAEGSYDKNEALQNADTTIRLYDFLTHPISYARADGKTASPGPGAVMSRRRGSRTGIWPA
jgi:hypothetical protein